MLGRWQPWHEGHTALFERCIRKTGQVIIQIRDVQGVSGGERQEDNPFSLNDISKDIEKNLSQKNYKKGIDYEVMLVPNIVNISYGRGVGYTFDEEKFDKAISDISATEIRRRMRDQGEL